MRLGEAQKQLEGVGAKSAKNKRKSLLKAPGGGDHKELKQIRGLEGKLEGLKGALAREKTVNLSMRQEHEAFQSETRAKVLAVTSMGEKAAEQVGTNEPTNTEPNSPQH